MKCLLILTMLFSFSTYAVMPIKKGEVSQSDGYVFTVEEEKKLRQINEENLTLKDLQVHLEEKSSIQDQRIEVYSKYFKEHKELGPWAKAGYIAAGAVGATLVIYLGTVVVKSMVK